jgi:hypothetical protein
MPIKDAEARKAYQREYSQRKRVEAYSRVKQWRKKNPDKVAEQNRVYAEKYPEKLVEKSIRWKRKNPERAAQVSRASRLKNKGRVVANKAAYRAAKKNRTPCWLTDFDRLKIKCMYQLAAMYSRENDLKFEVDHIIPLCGEFVSGLHVPNNLQVIRAYENRTKNNKFEVSNA